MFITLNLSVCGAEQGTHVANFSSLAAVRPQPSSHNKCLKTEHEHRLLEGRVEVLPGQVFSLDKQVSRARGSFSWSFSFFFTRNRLSEVFGASYRCRLRASWHRAVADKTKRIERASGKDASLEIHMGVKRLHDIFLGTEDLMLTGKDWWTTSLGLEAAGVGISGEGSRITSGGRLQTNRITKFNSGSLLHLYSSTGFLHSLPMYLIHHSVPWQRLSHLSGSNYNKGC